MKLRIALLFFLFAAFLLSGVYMAYQSLQPASLDEVAEDIAERLSVELAKADADASLLISNNSLTPESFSYPVYIYEQKSLVYWSDNTFVPPVQAALDTFRTRLYLTGSEAYLFRRNKVNETRVIISAIKLFRRYPISNDYLSTEFNQDILPVPHIELHDVSYPEGIHVCVNNNCLFKIDFPTGEIPGPTNKKVAAVILITIGIILFLYSIFYTARFFEWWTREPGFLYLLFIFWLLRVIMTETGFPAAFIEHPLFDPQVFASSSLNSSLVDLLLNLLTVAALCYFIFSNYFRFWIQRDFQNKAASWALSVFSALCILFAILFPVVVIQTLYNNSSVAIDISQSIRFDSLRIVSILSVVISGICAFLFSHAFIRTLIRNGKPARIWISFFVATVIFAGINEASNQQYLSSLILGVLYFSIVYLLDIARTLKRLTFGTFAYLFITIVFLSANVAYAVQFFTKKEKIENQYRFANNFLIDRDIFGEYLLNEAAQKISRDAFIQTRIASPFLGKETIRQKIRQVFLPTYFNKYGVTIYLFSANGESMDGRGITFADLLNDYDKDAYKTSYENVYFVSNPESDIAQEYLIKIPIKKGSIVGHIIVKLSLKRIIPENVYPELLVDYRFQQFYRTQDLSYAVIADGKFIFSSGEFNYERFFSRSWLGDPALYTKSKSDDAFDHIAIEDQSERIAIVSTRQIPFVYKLANFSFFLVLGLLIILAMIFVQGVSHYFRGSRLFFSARIQLYLNLAFFIPLIIVSISTLSLTSRSSQRQLDEQYLNKSRVFSQQIVNYLDDGDGRGDMGSLAIGNRITELANISDIDANLYNRSGKLMASSQPLIFESNLLSDYMNAAAYQRVRSGETLFIESERVGKLNYFVSYSTLKSSRTGRLMGIIALPFFQSEYLLEKLQIVILVNILNIFAFIFIVLLFLSYIVADRLTFPLRFITDSLKKTSLTNSNTPLTWHASDEIGLMVKEYNSMLYKLSESKSELEQTQREKAWREIAQQVAHEIKNPLTPMKLTLQQLERGLQSGSNTPEKTTRAVETLLGQVDTLNDIASSFSGFVKMPEPVMQPMELVSSLQRVIDLHSPTGEILLKTNHKEVHVLGDSQLLSRTFSNIILNALQSGIPGQQIIIIIMLEVVGTKTRITFIDNGKGIEPQIADRIFTPHFTTKKSGSGLGLAIARQAIEQMKGRIWFDTQIGKGTSFFIELPVL